MKKRQPRAAKRQKIRQKRAINPHEIDRRMRQAGYFQPVKRKNHTTAQRIAALTTLVLIAGLITLIAYALNLPNNQPNPWHDQGTTASK